MNNANTYQVAIVGGGPVGLFLAICLQRANISCVVLEQRAQTVSHSRSIGIHPVSLELLAPLELADSFIDAGVKVKKGLAFVGNEHCGTISFASCPPPYPFILTLPQHKTETILASHLHTLSPEILWRDTEAKKINPTAHGVKIEVNHSGQQKIINANYVVGCDGKDSFVRQSAYIPFTQTAYNDTYIMGDFSDNTNLGTDAAVYLCRDGLIESFPLPGNYRRWVVKTNQYFSQITRNQIEKRISERIDHCLKGTQNIMLSSFGVQKGLAETMAKKRIILAGDAAHLISPIGGQGMNLGWIDAHDLAYCLERIIINQEEPKKIVENYSKRRLAIARKAIRRAEFNMALGRKTGRPWVKKMMLWPLLKKPIAPLMARLFTMRGLQSLPF